MECSLRWFSGGLDRSAIDTERDTCWIGSVRVEEHCTLYYRTSWQQSTPYLGLAVLGGSAGRMHGHCMLYYSTVIHTTYKCLLHRERSLAAWKDTRLSAPTQDFFQTAIHTPPKNCRIRGVRREDTYVVQQSTHAPETSSSQFSTLYHKTYRIRRVRSRGNDWLAVTVVIACFIHPHPSEYLPHRERSGRGHIQ